jgi:hypothetical protein
MLKTLILILKAKKRYLSVLKKVHFGCSMKDKSERLKVLLGTEATSAGIQAGEE